MDLKLLIQLVWTIVAINSCGCSDIATIENARHHVKEYRFLDAQRIEFI